jgi:adenylate kinase
LINADPRSNYSLKKIQENNTAEIMQTVLEEARGAYAEEIIVELESDSIEALESNVERIVEWIKAWQKDREESTKGA